MIAIFDVMNKTEKHFSAQLFAYIKISAVQRLLPSPTLSPQCRDNLVGPIKVAQYYTQLPDKKVLAEKMQRAIAIAKARHNEQK